MLVLNNYERLVEACARLADAVLSACPGVRVLATSREPLRVEGEITCRVPSLAVPDLASMPHLDKLARFPAVRLSSEPAVLFRELHGLGAIAHAQLAEDLRHAVADGALGQPESRCQLSSR